MKDKIEKYEKYLKTEAKKFRISADDLTNLYDCFYMLDDDTYQTFKLNKMRKWFGDFFDRIQRIVVPEIYQDDKKK